jgi:hypothetical protein
MGKSHLLGDNGEPTYIHEPNDNEEVEGGNKAVHKAVHRAVVVY